MLCYKKDDILLMDIELNGLHGINLASAIREKDKLAMMTGEWLWQLIKEEQKNERNNNDW